MLFSVLLGVNIWTFHLNIAASSWNYSNEQTALLTLMVFGNGNEGIDKAGPPQCSLRRSQVLLWKWMSIRGQLHVIAQGDQHLCHAPGLSQCELAFTTEFSDSGLQSPVLLLTVLGSGLITHYYITKNPSAPKNTIWGKYCLPSFLYQVSWQHCKPWPSLKQILLFRKILFSDFLNPIIRS